jgi:hypothetical protein
MAISWTSCGIGKAISYLKDYRAFKPSGKNRDSVLLKLLFWSWLLECEIAARTMSFSLIASSY